jgi:hypothetical protein
VLQIYLVLIGKFSVKQQKNGFEIMHKLVAQQETWTKPIGTVLYLMESGGKG